MPEFGEYQIVKEGGEKVLRVNYEGAPFTPSIEDEPSVMSRVFDILLDVGKVAKIVLLQREEYEYDWALTKILLEIVDVYKKLIREEKILEIGLADPSCARYVPAWRAFLQDVLLRQLKEDPIGAFVMLQRRAREEKVRTEKPLTPDYATCAAPFAFALKRCLDLLSQTTLIRLVSERLEGYTVGDRTLYKELLKPTIRPNFMYTKLVTMYPSGAEELAAYKIAEDNQVLILKTPYDVRPLYHLIPKEFLLDQESYDLLITAREVLAEHKPQRSEFIDPARTREIFQSIALDLLQDLAKTKGYSFSYKEFEELAQILVRYTIGFGLIEIILSDPNIQDLVVNAPLGRTPISIIHGDFGECITNIIPLQREGESWATKLRLISGRPFDEANPVLDTDLALPYARARVAALQRPLSPQGYAFAFRRHRDKSWTLPLFIQSKMLTPLAAGLLSFLIDGARTMLIAGTRSAGKTSLLGALIAEISRTNRILTVEDTLELPVAQYRSLGYDILSMKTRSVITGAEAEVPAEQAIRTALRLGDSALIIGEVRSVEVRALYEAMRVGALAKTVAGTIHGAGPYDVYDRVVNDLGVPKTSFKATDIIAVANVVTSPSGLERWRRLTQIAEVRKVWTEDPIAEKGFADLMKYNAAKDQLEPAPGLMEGESEIVKAVGSRVREWAGNWDAMWQNIELRAQLKQELVEAAQKAGLPNLLEAPFVVRANDEFHRLCGVVAEEVGYTDPKRVHSEWLAWLKQQIKKEKEKM
ncbi:MAG: ATPase, T2SS/T4P/T4SS family [Candidatus Nanoarchaeia archaeon]